MSTILKFDFQKIKQLHFTEENYLNYTIKTQLLLVTITFSVKQTKQAVDLLFYPNIIDTALP